MLGGIEPDLTRPWSDRFVSKEHKEVICYFRGDLGTVSNVSAAVLIIFILIRSSM